jgi:hypothetical protein
MVVVAALHAGAVGGIALLVAEVRVIAANVVVVTEQGEAGGR